MKWEVAASSAEENLMQLSTRHESLGLRDNHNASSNVLQLTTLKCNFGWGYTVEDSWGWGDTVEDSWRQ